jgi:hypothetical protein
MDVVTRPTSYMRSPCFSVPVCNPVFVQVWTDSECFASNAIYPWVVAWYGNNEEADHWGKECSQSSYHIHYPLEIHHGRQHTAVYPVPGFGEVDEGADACGPWVKPTRDETHRPSQKILDLMRLAVVPWLNATSASSAHLIPIIMQTLMLHLNFSPMYLVRHRQLEIHYGRQHTAVYPAPVAWGTGKSDRAGESA